jgi:hypothetical protein
MIPSLRKRERTRPYPQAVARFAGWGRKAEALKILRDLQERSKREFVPSYSLATIYLGLEMKEEAIQHINKAYEEGSFYMIHLKVDPLLDSVRSDRRFADVLKRVGH